MKRIGITTIAVLAFATIPAQADELFTGDVRLACEAVLCLSSGTRPSECAPSLKRYYNISFKKMSKTIRERKKFLNMCPTASHDAKMVALVDAISNGAGRCDYASLNSTLRVWNWRYDRAETYIKNTLPSYCSSYSNNAYTDLEAPRYVGVPERGGHWVQAKNYESALAEYNKRIAAEGTSRRRNNYYFGGN